MGTTARDAATGDWAIVREADDEASVARAGARFGVVLNDAGNVVGIGDDAGLHPAVVVPAGADVDMLAEADDIVAAIGDGVPGVVVVDGQGPVGVIPARALQPRRELFHSDSPFGDRDVRIPPLSIECATCGTTNLVPFFADGYTPCVNDHLLRQR